jgi:hypothetical protein
LNTCQNRPCPAEEPTLDFGMRGHGAANADLDAIPVYLREELLLAKVEAGADPVVITGWMKETQANRALAEARLNKPTAARRRQLTEEEITALVANVDGIMQALKDVDRADKADLYSRLQVTLKYYPSEKRVAAEARRPSHRPNRSSRAPASGSAMSPSRSLHPITWAAAEAISWNRPADRRPVPGSRRHALSDLPTQPGHDAQTRSRRPIIRRSCDTSQAPEWMICPHPCAWSRK